MSTKSARYGCQQWYQCKSCLKLLDSKDTYRKHFRLEHVRQRENARERPIKRTHSETTQTSHTTNASAEAKDQVKVEEVSPKLPTKSEEASSVKSSNRNLAVVLHRLRINEILVTSPSPGLREVYYTGVEEQQQSSGPIRAKRPKLSEWRLERVAAFKRKRNDGEPDKSSSSWFGKSEEDIKAESKEEAVVLYVPVELPFVFNVSGWKEDLHTILDVLTGQKMTTILLDAAIASLLERHRHNRSPASDKTNFSPEHLPVHFLPVLERDQDVRKIKANMSHFPSSKLTDNTLLIAPLYTCKHFYLAVVDFKCNTVRVYDSCWHFVPLYLRLHQVKKIMKYLISEELKSLTGLTWNINFIQLCSQQIDEYSCGYYVINFAKNELEGNPDKNTVALTKPDLLEIRRSIVTNLLPSTNIGSRLLEALTE